MPSPAEILTEDQRLLLAAAGPATLLRVLTDPDYGIAELFDSHRSCTITDEVYALRPEWKAARVLFAVDPKHGIHLMRSLLRDSPDAPKVSISRKRLHAYAASLPPAWIEALRGLRGSYRLIIDDAVWQALLLPGRPYRDQMEQINAGSSKTVPAATVDRMPSEHEYEPVETVALGDKMAELLAAWESGEPLTGGQLFGLPPLDGDVWVDIAGASVITRVEPKTITSFLSRGKPKACPFPTPSKFLGRLYWPATTLLSWTTQYKLVRRTEPTT
ncbi:hypothetical protein [Nocardia sp. NPDC004711]